MQRAHLSLVVIFLLSFAPVNGAADDPLPSWNDGPSKTAITFIVTKVTKERSPDFVASQDRIAVFDKHGTFWAEQPLYFQILFMLDHVKAAAPPHPEWRDNPVFEVDVLSVHTRSRLLRDGRITLGDQAVDRFVCRPDFKGPYFHARMFRHQRDGMVQVAGLQ